MVSVSGTIEHDTKAIRASCPTAGIRSGPIVAGLFANGGGKETDSIVELLECFGFGRRVLVGKFLLSVAHIPGLRDLCADVVVDIAGKVQHQVANVVSVWKGIAP